MPEFLRIDGLTAAGAVVHVEGSRLIIDDADGTPDEQELLAGLRPATNGKLRVAGLGLIHQVDGLRYPTHWQIIDLSYLQILRRLGPATIRKITAAGGSTATSTTNTTGRSTGVCAKRDRADPRPAGHRGGSDGGRVTE